MRQRVCGDIKHTSTKICCELHMSFDKGLFLAHQAKRKSYELMRRSKIVI